MTLAAQIEEGLRDMQVVTDAAKVARLDAYLQLMEKWNRIHNLTAVRDTGQMVTLHVLDSLSLLPHIEGVHSLLDVGTGPGLPGIPVAIARPDLAVTLLDSSHKKCAFLEQARVEVGLANVTVVCERVEQYKPAQLFDAVVSRAFSDLPDFVSQARHLVGSGGRMIAMKGVYPFDEIARVPPSHRVASVVELHVPRLDAKRHLVVVEAA